jgi:hypothetical protein
VAHKIVAVTLEVSAQNYRDGQFNSLKDAREGLGLSMRSRALFSLRNLIGQARDPGKAAEIRTRVYTTPKPSLIRADS